MNHRMESGLIPSIPRCILQWERQKALLRAPSGRGEFFRAGKMDNGDGIAFLGYKTLSFQRATCIIFFLQLTKKKKIEVSSLLPPLPWGNSTTCPQLALDRPFWPDSCFGDSRKLRTFFYFHFLKMKFKYWTLLCL